jgi:hypothetical protein
MKVYGLYEWKIEIVFSQKEEEKKKKRKLNENRGCLFIL